MATDGSWAAELWGTAHGRAATPFPPKPFYARRAARGAQGSRQRWEGAQSKSPPGNPELFPPASVPPGPEAQHTTERARLPPAAQRSPPAARSCSAPLPRAAPRRPAPRSGPTPPTAPRRPLPGAGCSETPPAHRADPGRPRSPASRVPPAAVLVSPLRKPRFTLGFQAPRPAAPTRGVLAGLGAVRCNPQLLLSL